ncbi:MAG: hypothetical protein NTW21_14440 [Verrucomicrobia bacterium]|nr:hypothetical protein [Verrucomicrobiota bacterium]
MSLRAKDKAFRLPKISVIDFKSIEMDRTLTALFARIHHQGMDSRLSKPNTTLEDFEQHILEKPDRFKGFSSHHQRTFVVKCLDAFLLKNRPGALIAQARSSRAPRRFILDSRLLELLLQINVLQYDPAKGSYKSEEMQIEKLLDVLKRRYGLHIDSLPVGEGFQEPSIDQRSALKDNRDAFKDKLREIGFFQDLSDAYVTQHVRPRYQID